MNLFNKKTLCLVALASSAYMFGGDNGQGQRSRQGQIVTRTTADDEQALEAMLQLIHNSGNHPSLTLDDIRGVVREGNRSIEEYNTKVDAGSVVMGQNLPPFTKVIRTLSGPATDFQLRDALKAAETTKAAALRQQQ